VTHRTEKDGVYYESIKRESKITGIYECRCDERLQTKTKEFTRLPYTGLVFVLVGLGTATPKNNEKKFRKIKSKIFFSAVSFSLLG
jgi:hypothetical protein